MCLFLNYSNCLDKEMFEANPDKFIKCYKVLSRVGNNLLSPFYGVPYRYGWNLSDRNSKKIYINELIRDVINEGIHVFLEELSDWFIHSSFHYCGRDLVLANCVGLKSDFVAKGTFMGKESAVFMRIFLQSIKE